MGLKLLFVYLTLSSAIHFHHSVVVAICHAEHHSGPELASKFIPLVGHGQSASGMLETRSTATISKPAAVRSSGEDRVTLDLHTRTGLIGRRDLDVTLATLRLDEEEADGYVDIYAVCRFLEPGVSNFADLAEIGRESLFRASASWVH